MWAEDPEAAAKQRWYANDWRKRLKSEVYEAYGGSCYCCGTSDHRFLSLDHCNNDGAEHRRSLDGAGGWRMHMWAKRNGFPSSLRLACFNCNTARQFAGPPYICPHQAEVAP